MTLETWDVRSVTHGAALLLTARDACLGDPAGPWSIAELSLTDLDFERLLVWSRQASGDAVKSLIERTDLLPLPEPRSHDLLAGDVISGLLLLALSAECTARNGSTEAPWRSVADTIGDCSLRRALFTPGGAPLRPLRDAMLAAARRCWMRSGDLDDPTTNRWYKLLLLQGGIPQRDVALLARWLSAPDGRTFLVDDLQLGVPTFRVAWEALERLRHGQTSRDRARKAIAACPFFRGPQDDILDAAVRRLEPGESRVAPAASASVLSASVALDWPRDAPTPRATLTPNFSADEALGSRIDLSVDGIHRARYRRTQGVLARFGGPSGLTELLALRWTLSAKGDSEAEIVQVEVGLFEDDDDVVTCFDGAGARCGAGAQAVRYVLARDELVTRPAQRVAWLEAQGLAVAAVEPGTVVSTADGVHLWPPNPAGHAVDADMLTLEIADVREGAAPGALVVCVTHEPTLRVKAARVGSASFRAISADNSGTTKLEGVVPAASATPELRLTLTAAIANRVFQRTVRLRAFTAASIDGAWLTSTSIVEAERLRGGALRVALGPEYVGRDARLVAGGASATIALTARHIPRVPVLGYGEHLLLCGQEPWLDGPRRTLVGRIEDHGHMVGHELLDGRLRIVHRLNIEAGPEHWVLVWPRRGIPLALPLDAETRSARWTDRSFTLPYFADEPPRAVALCYGTAVEGASWAEDWSLNLASCPVDAVQLVKTIRALSLPVLADPHLRTVADRLRHLGLPEATAALADNHGDDESLSVGAAQLRPSGDRDRWPRVARAMLVELRLSSEEHLQKLRRRMDARCPPPKLTPGIPATPEQLRELGQRTQGGSTAAFLSLLLRAGAIHPRDAVCLTPELRRERRRLAINLADLSRGLNVRLLEGESDGAKRRLRSNRLTVLRRQLGLGEGTVVQTLTAAAAWGETTRSPDMLLHAALVDEFMCQRIQLELLDDLAFK